MAKTVKSCDLPIGVAVKVFEMLNPKYVKLAILNGAGHVIVTDKEPKDLNYPEGWYYAKGTFRNKHTSSTGMYGEALMVNSNYEAWDELGAKYCTRDDI